MTAPIACDPAQPFHGVNQMPGTEKSALLLSITVFRMRLPPVRGAEPIRRKKKTGGVLCVPLPTPGSAGPRPALMGESEPIFVSPDDLNFPRKTHREAGRTRGARIGPKREHESPVCHCQGFRLVPDISGWGCHLSTVRPPTSA